MGTQVVSKFMVPSGTALMSDEIRVANPHDYPMIVTVELLVPDPPITEADLAYVPEGWHPGDCDD